MLKKLIIVLQILAFVSQSVHADDTRSLSTPSAPTVETTVSQMPANYRLPDLSLLDSVAFYNKFRDQQGKRIDVEAYTGRFGSTFGEEFKQKIYELERANEGPLEIILTLTSTKEDAKVYKDKLAAMNRKAVIVEIPDHIQKEFLERADAKLAGGLKELWWDTKNATGKLINFKETLAQSKTIMRDQFTKPNRYDQDLMYLSLKVTGLSAVGLLFVGADPTLVLTMAFVRAALNGSSQAFRRTIKHLFMKNLFLTNATNDLYIASPLQQKLMKLFTLSLGFSESYYAIGSSLGGAEYGLTQKQVLFNTGTSGVIDTVSTYERDNRLSQIALARMIRYTIVLGAAFSSFSMTGNVGPVFEYGFVQISTLQAMTLSVFTGLLLAYRYKSHQVEKFAQQGFMSTMRQKLERLEKFRLARNERLDKERTESIARKQRIQELLNEMRAQKKKPHISPAASSPASSRVMCTSLFQ